MLDGAAKERLEQDEGVSAPKKGVDNVHAFQGGFQLTK
jgi:hypothetical protein